MTEAEQGIKITEAGITMKECLLIVLGWALGIAGSIFYYWFERFRKRREFKNGLKSELIAILPRMVTTVSALKLKLGILNHETLNWTRDSLLKYYNHEKIDEILPKTNELLNHTPDTLKEALYHFKILKEDGNEKALRKFNLVFLKSNLDRILLLDIDSQKLIYNIQDEIDVINQAVDRYFFFLDKTFEPEVIKVNKNPLKENIDGSYEFISENLFLVTNDVITLLEKL